MNATHLQKVLLFVLAVAVPLLFVANVRQSFRYVQVQRSLESIQSEHIQLLEENKRLVVGIAGLRAPGRIRGVAREELELVPLPAERVRRIRIRGAADER